MQELLNKLNADNQRLTRYSFTRPIYCYRPKQNHVDLNDLMERSAPTLSAANPVNFDSWIGQRNENESDRSDLMKFLSHLTSRASGRRYEYRYAKDLAESSKSLDSCTECKINGSIEALQPLLEKYMTQCRKHVDDVYHTIRHHLRSEKATARQLACKTNMWPRLSVTSLLRQLAYSQTASLRDEWKHSLVKFGESISKQQRAQRLLACCEDESELLAELDNPGHQNWDPFQRPKWLLFEIENNLLIRPTQA
jgi:hypothetical protein